MWYALRTKVETLAPRLSPSWRARLTAAIQCIDSTLGSRDADLLVGMAHRDFGPWNTRCHRDGRLFVFDWDAAQEEMTPLYDLFNFHFVSRSASSMKSHLTHPVPFVHKLLVACLKWRLFQEVSLYPQLFLAYVTDRAVSRLNRVLWHADSQEDDPMLQLISRILDTYGEWCFHPSQNA
jgi:hypothetical protein